MNTEPLGGNNYSEPYRDASDEQPSFGAFNLQSLERLESANGSNEVPVVDMDPELTAELRDAVGLGDDDLIAHDIWFVTTGASSMDHAGIKAFLDEHRKDIRGAFMVNLDSVGRGDLTLLTSEGSGSRHRSDRRLSRLFTNIAEFFKINLGRKDYRWEETDGTPAIQRSVRVSTLMGMSKDGLPTSSHTADDEPEYLNDQQIADVADMVTEMIRRS